MNGVVYYNRATKCLVRLAVSASTLRKHFDGPVTLLSQGDRSHAASREIAERFGLEFKEVEYPQTPEKRGATYINATLCHHHVDYDATIWLDSDTIVCGDISPLHELALQNDFVATQIAHWGSKRGSRVGKRINWWKDIHPDEKLAKSYDQNWGINCGVFAFPKGSKWMADWWQNAMKGIDTPRIQDEVCAQIMLGEYAHAKAPNIFNVSAKYGTVEDFADVRIVHFHGNKHCRFSPDGKFTNNSHLWYREFEEIRDWPLLTKYTQSDRMLRKYVKRWDAIKDEFRADPTNDKWYARSSQGRIKNA